MNRLGIDVGDTVEVAGQRRTICKVLPTFKEHRGKGHVQIDGVARGNCGSGIGEPVVIRPVFARPAVEVVLVPQGHNVSNRDLEYIGSLLDGLPAIAGDNVRQRCSATAQPISWSRAQCPKGRSLSPPIAC